MGTDTGQTSSGAHVGFAIGLNEADDKAGLSIHKPVGNMREGGQFHPGMESLYYIKPAWVNRKFH